MGRWARFEMTRGLCTGAENKGRYDETRKANWTNTNRTSSGVEIEHKEMFGENQVPKKTFETNLKDKQMQQTSMKQPHSVYSS